MLNVRPDAAVITFSSVNGDGRRELWSWVAQALSLWPSVWKS